MYDEANSKDDKLIVDRTVKKKLTPDEVGDFEKIKTVLKDIDDSDFRVLEFRNTGQTDVQLKKKIQGLFDKAKERWSGLGLSGILCKYRFCD